MNELSQKLRNIQETLNESDSTLKQVYEKIATSEDADPDDRETARQGYESYLSDYEVAYQRLNTEYKETIAGFSDAYLSMCPYYVGPEIPRPHFLSSKEEVKQLYGLFFLAGLASLFGFTER